LLRITLASRHPPAPSSWPPSVLPVAGGGFVCALLPDGQIPASGLEFALMSRPPQNPCLIDYFLAECERIFVWYRFLLREKLKKRRSRKVAEFIARARQFPLRTHVQPNPAAWKMG
jgi:hypothetical protein